MKKTVGADRKRTKRRARRGFGQIPQTAQQYFARSERFQDTWNRVAHVIAKMRSQKLSMTRAAREVGVSPRTVTRWGKTALRKNRTGRFIAKRTDRLLRVLQIPSADGMREIAVRNSRDASALGEYSAALSKYMTTGNGSDVLRFSEVYVTDVTGSRVRLLTDLTEIDRLAGAGVLSFESLYSRS